MKNIFCLIGLLVIVLSCDDILEVEDISKKSVEILAPTNNSIIDTTYVSFTWNTVIGADNYKLQIATPDFENTIQIITDTITTKTSFSQTLVPKNYEWRVRAENSNYHTSFSTHAFSVSDSL